MTTRLFLVIIIISFLPTLPGCNYQKYKDRIAGDKGTYWDVIKSRNQSFKEPLNSWFFAINGDCKYYKFDKMPDGSLTRTIVDTTGSTYPHKWKMTGDTLALPGAAYLLISTKNKKLLLTNLNDPADSLLLVESAAQ